ncbi:helix-turn-helix domain-containing protein [Cryptosporangium aurantiacum]|uniref:Transcriptional regulator, AraC family with amidase-like domain n=1 Tax=Cryptosporangium aurantiacum TaxID=134849 RepID=A0A1M7RHD6_9ACTN|nr:helix-turn-helix domain-containing protein [Cryptosporangium aurantiacum]SHN45640.1 transcriptional regulator, AraC family with amidase-like domain [Cryptosporangium aurantiacum]
MIVTGVTPTMIGALTFGIVTEVFGYDRTDIGLPTFDFAIVPAEDGPIRTRYGATIQLDGDFSRIDDSDLVLVMPWETFSPPPVAYLDALRRAYDRGATLMGFCSGTFVLASTGLLDGRRATTHWCNSSFIAETFPQVTIDADVLYVDEGRVLTGAGSAAGLDLCLHWVRREYGARVANALARSVVIPPHRDGGQAQYIVSPLPEVGDSERLVDVLAWMRANLHLPLTVETLAAKALMSPRSFARHFRATTGTTPRAWLLAQRLHRAEELLEGGDLPVEEVARRVGFGTAAALRDQFVRRRGVPPREYRRAFRCAAECPEEEGAA